MIEAPEPSIDGVCSVHADREADAGTCGRCGSFMCGECLHEGTERALCEACFERIESPDAVRRLPIFAIVMMAHGGIILLMGLFFTIYAFSLGVSFSSMDPPSGSTPEAAALLPGMMTGLLGIMALVHVGVGLLQLVAGFQVLKYRMRGLAVVALVSGLATFIGCYCGITSVTLLIVGLVVLFQDDVSRRFEIGG